MDYFGYLCLAFAMFSYLFIAALWSPAGKGLTSWLWFVIIYYVIMFLSLTHPESAVVLACINS